MTYLDLVNAVLIRLREDTITAGEVDSNPYYRVIGSHVNDAKRRIETMWDWSYLRFRDLVDISEGDSSVDLPDSFDNNFVVKRMYSSDQYSDLNTNVPQQYRMKQMPVELLRRQYSGGSIGGLPQGQPIQFAPDGRSAAGLLKVTFYPAADRDLTLTVDNSHDLPDLVAATDICLLPSLPVYSLATALASRERGEVGGAPTSELFRLADQHVSDAIAIDSASYPSDLDFYSAGAGWGNTNVVHA